MNGLARTFFGLCRIHFVCRRDRVLRYPARIEYYVWDVLMRLDAVKKSSVG